MTAVKEWLTKDSSKSIERVVFNVFTPKDDEIYKELAPKYFS
jgi:hypothetical protein